MTSNRCKEPAVGLLLHAHELRILSPEDDERLEIHLMQCSFCFTEAMEFAPNATKLRTDKAVRAEVDCKDPGVVGSAGLLQWLRLYLCPNGSLVYKPVLSLLLILFLLYPAYLGLKPHRDPDIRPVKLISLSSNRSAEPESITVVGDRDLLLVFYFEQAVPGKQYTVSITDKFEAVLYYDETFSDFDLHSVGTILVPSTRIDVGLHTLTVVDPASLSPGSRQEYTFIVSR